MSKCPRCGETTSDSELEECSGICGYCWDEELDRKIADGYD